MAALLCGLAACGDSTEDKCEKLVDTVCDYLAGCLEEVGVDKTLADKQRASCVKDQKAALQCDDASDVDDKKLNACVDQLNDLSCEDGIAVNSSRVFLDVPEVCNQVVKQ